MDLGAYEQSEHHGWTIVAVAMLILFGGIQAIAGLLRGLKSSLHVVSDGHLTGYNYALWTWVNLILGLLIIFIALAVASGAAWAKVTAISLVGIGIILTTVDNILFLHGFPYWSIMLIGAGLLSVYALIAHIAT